MAPPTANQTPQQYIDEQGIEKLVTAAVKTAVLERAPSASLRVAELLTQQAQSNSHAQNGNGHFADLLTQQAQSNSHAQNGNGHFADDEVARLRAELAAARAEVAELRGQAKTVERAMGDNGPGVHGMNMALYKLGALKHEPPAFRFFDPGLEERKAVVSKEIKLPRADQTHEVVFEPKNRCLFISQMSNSVLVRIPVGSDGLLLDDQDAWRVGPAHPKTGDGIGGLHNLSLSRKNPGCLWVSLQFANTLLLVDGATMQIKQIIKVPTLLKRADGTVLRVGGPHCIRECPSTGKIWVALKGSVPCHPGGEGFSARSLRDAAERICCNKEAYQERIALNGGLPQDAVAFEEGFAIWWLDPSKYEPKDGNNQQGGVLFECLPSPPMVSIDHECNCWVAQDKSPTILMIDHARATEIVVERDAAEKAGKQKHPAAKAAAASEDAAKQQFHVKFDDEKVYRVKVSTDDGRVENGPPLKITGPAIATAPDGAIWCSLLGSDGTLVRIDPTTGSKRRYEFPTAPWMSSCRIIHMAFHRAESQWHIWNAEKVTESYVDYLYFISSDLVDDEACNVLVRLQCNPFEGSGWETFVGMREIPLPMQESCCHRVEVIAEGLPPEDHSVVVSMLSSSRVFQIKVHHLENNNFFHETIKDIEDGWQVVSYETTGSCNSKAKSASKLAELLSLVDKFYATAAQRTSDGILIPIAEVKARIQQAGSTGINEERFSSWSSALSRKDAFSGQLHAPPRAWDPKSTTAREWRCGCGEVRIRLEGEPLFELDCHCSACTPVARSLDAKSGGRGISAIVNKTGVAKSFYLLDRVKFLRGKEKIGGVKLGVEGQNVRAHTTCCHTMVIGDSPVPFDFRPFNRNAIFNLDGSKYVPADPVWGCKGGGNPWWDDVPEPKHPGDPDWLVAKIEALERETHGAAHTYIGDPSPGFYPDPSKIPDFVDKPKQKGFVPKQYG